MCRRLQLREHLGLQLQPHCDSDAPEFEVHQRLILGHDAPSFSRNPNEAGRTLERDEHHERPA